MRERSVVIFRDHLLPASETFILAAGEALRRYTPYYIGSRQVRGLTTPSDRTFALNRFGRLGAILEVPFKVFGAPWQFGNHLRRIRPSLIHAHFGPDGALALPIARALGVPMIVTFHGFDATMREAVIRSRVHRRYLRRRSDLQKSVPRFIAVSDFIKRCMIRQGYPAERIIVHYIGIDVRQFQPNLDAERHPVVLFVGRLVEKKGCEHLIEAMAKVCAENPDVELVIIGDGPLRDRLEAIARSTRVRHRFLGVQPPAVVKDWMNRSRVFCVPSITAASGDAEGFGMVFAEAQAMGLPVVSSFSGGIPEAVAHGETGFLAQERASDELATYILKLLRDDDTWREFSIAGRRRVEERFDLWRQTALLEEIYHEVETGFLSPEFEPVGR